MPMYVLSIVNILSNISVSSNMRYTKEPLMSGLLSDCSERRMVALISVSHPFEHR